MITQLSIQGFKSFGPCVSIRPGKLNFVVGANASGKTNLLSALRFVQSVLSTNLEQALGDLGGKAEVRNRIQRERKEGKHLEINLTTGGLGAYENHEGRRFEVSSATYNLKVELPSANGRAAIIGEHLRAVLRTEQSHDQHYELHRTLNRLELHDPSDAAFSTPKRMEVPVEEHFRSAVSGGFYTRPALLFRESVRSWLFFSLDAKAGRAASREAEAAVLGPNGENLAAVLHEIEERGGLDCLERIASGLRGVVPGFENIQAISLPFEAKWGFQVREERLRGGLNPGSVSDGTIRLLLLLTIAEWSGKRSKLIAIEEPENGLHPFLARQLVDVFRAASTERQFLITTHNPFFLDHLEAEELLLCDKREGFSTIRRASDIDEIHGFQKHFSLGELWTQGVLEGIP